MIVTATCSGGFAGLSQTYRIDTASAPDGAAVEAMLAGAGLLAKPAGGAPRAAAEGADATAATGADLQHWHITVVDGGHENTSAFADAGAPALRWRPLLQRLRAAGPA